MSIDTNEILTLALKNEDEIIIAEAIKGSAFKYIGTKNIDLHIFTNKTYVKRILRNNILKIKDAIKELEGKSVRKVYIDNELFELSLKELSSKKDISTIDLNSLKNVKKEISGENDIVHEIFSYESSILNKKYLIVSLYNKELNKEFTLKVNSNVIKSNFHIIKRKRISKSIKKLLNLKYLPTNNDSKEFIELLNIL